MHDQVLDQIARKKREIEERLKEVAELEELLRLADKHRLEVSVPIAASLNRLQAQLEVRPSELQTLRERIIAAAESVLSDGKRRVARELLPEMAKYGVKLEGKNPQSNLSSYLSREKDKFVSDVKLGGWTLRSLAVQARALDAPTSRALFNN